MKRFDIATFALCVLVACGGSKKGPATVGGGDTTPVGSAGGSAESAVAPPACSDEGAGRDVASATPLAAGAFKGCTDRSPDVYSILAPEHAPGTLYEIGISTPAQAVVATVLDQDGQELGAASVAKGQEGTAFVVLATSSRMFIRVVGDSAVVQPYTIAAKAKPLIDEDEPNDTAETASPLNLDKQRTALLQTAANNKNRSADFYRVLVGRDGTLVTNVEAGTDEVSLTVEVFDRAGTRIGEGTAANPGAAVQVSARVKRGDFVIKVVATDDGPSRAFSANTAPRYLQNGYRITATRK